MTDGSCEAKPIKALRTLWQNSGDNMKRNYKLTPEQVRAIRINRYGKTDKQQAKEYGVHKNTIYRARHGMIYRSIF